MQYNCVAYQSKYTLFLILMVAVPFMISRLSVEALILLCISFQKALGTKRLCAFVASLAYRQVQAAIPWHWHT